MNTRVLALVIGSLVATTAHAMKGDELSRLLDSWDRVNTGKAKGREDELAAATFVGYVRGVEDSMNGMRFCIPPKASSAEQVAHIAKYVKAHPEELHNGATTFIVQALQPAYPCAAGQ
jgi:Ssp1 endopeptidase immunity protein Rap1a